MKTYIAEYPYTTLYVVAKNIQAAIITADGYMAANYLGTHVMTSIKLEHGERVIVDTRTID